MTDTAKPAKKPQPAKVEHGAHEERIARLEKAIALGDPTAAAAMMKSKD